MASIVVMFTAMPLSKKERLKKVVEELGGTVVEGTVRRRTRT